MRFRFGVLNRPDIAAAVEQIVEVGVAFDEQDSSPARGYVCHGGGCIFHEIIDHLGKAATLRNWVEKEEEYLRPNPYEICKLLDIGVDHHGAVDTTSPEYYEVVDITRLNDSGQLATAAEVRGALVAEGEEEA